MLTRRGSWSNAVVLHKNTYRYFYADMDQDDVFHFIFQDNKGNIFYSRLDGQSIKTIPVLNSKSSSEYNKHLFIAPFNNSIYFFYVLQHENSFMLAYQALENNKISNPKVVDYVSGSSIPCTILYDNDQNIYVFYQSYDGKYLQLGYKKFITSQKHWSDFTPATKYSGNCEYPHAIMDETGLIHLCYQRRGPKLFEMVYQQKAPDKNLWSPEIVVHSSVHSFENASILQVRDKIVIYWVREDVIYYNAGSLNGSDWSKASRYAAQFGRQLECLCYKSNSPRDRVNKGDFSSLSPGIYPGTLANGLKLLFLPGDDSLLGSGSGTPGSVSGNEINRLADTLPKLQGSVDEIREGWSETRKEMARLINAYVELKKDIDKSLIRLDMLERQFGQTKRSGRKPEILPASAPIKEPVQENQKESIPRESLTKEASQMKVPPKEVSPKESLPKEVPQKEVAQKEAAQKETLQRENPVGSTLAPEKLLEWEEWKEPKEWQGVGE